MIEGYDLVAYSQFLQFGGQKVCNKITWLGRLRQ